MSSNEYLTPDLASILKTLASLTPQNQQQQLHQDTQEHQADDSYKPSPAQHPQRQWQPPVQAHPSPSSVNPPQLIDPTTIIDWPSGLKCVMKTVAKHEKMLHEVRRLIKHQHENEEAWWKSRQALIERQIVRKENEKKLDDVIKLVGGAPSKGTSNASPEELAKELQTFDMKVYKAQMQMAKEFTSKLRNLGVPFFETKSELVRKAKKEKTRDGNGDPQDAKGTIDEAELVKLQKKMLEMLEDLCTD